jgi:hypothetical protein
MKPNNRKKSNSHKKRSYPRQKNYAGCEPRLPGQSYHHVFPQSQYTTEDEHKLSRHPGVIKPLDIPVHDYLTATVPFPPKFKLNEIPDAVDFLNQSAEHDTKDNPFWGIEAIMRYTVFMEMDSEQHAERMHDIRWNLARQIGVMAGEHTFENPVTSIHSNVIDLNANVIHLQRGDQAA